MMTAVTIFINMIDAALAQQSADDSSSRVVWLCAVLRRAVVLCPTPTTT